MNSMQKRKLYLVLLVVALLPAVGSTESECKGFGETLAGGLCLRDSELLNAFADAEYKNGSAYGVRLSRIKRGSVLEERGFIESDVLLKLNGRNVLEIGLEGLRSGLKRSHGTVTCQALIKRRAIEQELDCSLMEQP